MPMSRAREVLVGVQDHLEAVAVHAPALWPGCHVRQPVGRLEAEAAPEVRVVGAVEVDALVRACSARRPCRAPGTASASRIQRARFSSVGTVMRSFR